VFRSAYRKQHPMACGGSFRPGSSRAVPLPCNLTASRYNCLDSMSRLPPTRLGSYEILARLGAGGMGEVYRARDTRLDREVAIKVLPAAVATDRERLARFEREAKVLASFNHPNIAQIYGLEESGETRALVMELVAGATLSVPQPIETALQYARQIAEALEAAHEKGITHRDLKPANIMIAAEGVVKVLDFGLASIPGREAGNDPANSPTMTIAATQAGIIMGTAGYMSPEQAAGKIVDKRSDIWSFGVVLWEMITGAKLFEGETISHTLADVLRAPIDFGKLPPSTPAPVAGLVKRCLDRDLRTRLRDIGEARIAIQEYLADPKGANTAPRVERRPAKMAWAPWAVAAGFAVAAAALGFVAYRHAQEPPPMIVRTSVLPPEKSTFVSYSPPSISPDGRRLAFAAVQDGKTSLWIRDVDSLAARSITGTDGAAFPFWSPDSQSVAFAADGKLKRIDISGGPALTLCPIQGNLHGGTWSHRGVILFPGSPVSGLSSVSDSGGTAVPVTTLDEAAGEISHRLPWFLPDGRHFLYSIRNRDQVTKSAIYVGDLDSKERKPLLKREGQAAYVPASGLLIFASGGISEGPLFAQVMNASTFETTGNLIPIAESVDLSTGVWGQHQFSVSRDGVLVYASSGASNSAQLTWFDRSGKVLGTVGGRDSGLRMGAISPDGKTVAADGSQSGSQEIWLHDLVRGTSSRLTFNPAGAGAMLPAWSPDGKSLIFGYFDSSHPMTIMRKAIRGGGVAEPAGSPWGNPPRAVSNISWSRDGRYIIARLIPGGLTGADIWMLPLNPPGEKPRPYLQSNANEGAPNLSPPGDWLAYMSDETRRFEIYVQSFPNPGQKYQVSLNGGGTPVWSRDGKELFFIAADRQMMAVSINSSGGSLQIGTPRALFDSKLALLLNAGFDVDKDGRFLIPVQEQGSAVPMTLAINWQAGLKK
jgi:eukaryotic-like serine/threonine-protein kinase